MNAKCLKTLEASIGIEPIYTDLQSVSQIAVSANKIRPANAVGQLETFAG